LKSDRRLVASKHAGARFAKGKGSVITALRLPEYEIEHACDEDKRQNIAQSCCNTQDGAGGFDFQFDRFSRKLFGGYTKFLELFYQGRPGLFLRCLLDATFEDHSQAVVVLGHALDISALNFGGDFVNRQYLLRRSLLIKVEHDHDNDRYKQQQVDKRRSISSWVHITSKSDDNRLNCRNYTNLWVRQVSGLTKSDNF